jgi:hypothetical protein
VLPLVCRKQKACQMPPRRRAEPPLSSPLKGSRRQKQTYRNRKIAIFAFYVRVDCCCLRVRAREGNRRACKSLTKTGGRGSVAFGIAARPFALSSIAGGAVASRSGQRMP